MRYEMAQKYSYKPARYSTGNLGRITHGAARKYTIKLYTQDTKIAQQHYDNLKRLRTTGVAVPKSQVLSAEDTNLKENPYEQIMTDMPLSTDGGTKLDSVVKTHEAMGDFHTKRAMAYLEAARLHTQLGLTLAKESANPAGHSPDKDVKVSDDDLEAPTTSFTRLPSLWDIHPEAMDHSYDAAMDYHTTLHGEAVLEAHSYRMLGEQIKTKMDTMNPEEPPEKKMKLREALEVCRELYTLHNNIAELHSLYANDFGDYLKRRADHTFGYEPDNTRDNPPTHQPNPNPWTVKPAVQNPDQV